METRRPSPGAEDARPRPFLEGRLLVWLPPCLSHSSARQNTPAGRSPLPRPHPHLHAGHVPNLVLQEVHVPVEQGVGRGEHAHGLHAGAALQLALHRHVGEAGQAEEGPLPEVAATGQVRSVAQNPSDTFPFSPAFSFEGQSPRREVTVRGLHEKAQPREPLL